MTDTELSPVQKRQLEAFRMPSPEEIKRVTNYALWEGFLEKQQALKSAAAVPLPGPSGNAFPVMPIRTKTFTVRPAKAGDWSNLQKLDSPVIKQVVECAKPEADRKPVEVNLQDMMVAVYCFTRPCKYIYDILAKDGAQKVKDLAFEEFSEVEPQDLNMLFEAAQGQVSKSFETVLEYGGEGSDKRFFQDTNQALKV